MKYSDLQKKGQTLTQSDMKVIQNRIASDLRESRDNINDRLKKLYDKNLTDIPKADRYNYMIQRGRMESLLKYSTEQYNAVRLATQQTQVSKVALSNEFYRQQFATEQMAGQLGVKYPFNVLNPEIAKASIYGEFVKDYEKFVPKYGGTLSAILSKNRTQDLQRIRQALVSGMIQGDSYSKISGSVKDAFNGSYNNALRVIRTEGHRNQEAAKLANSDSAKESGVDIVRKISSVSDIRTRSQSSSMDGQAEDKDGLFHYPNGATAAYPGNSGVAAYDINDRETVRDTIGGRDPQLKRVRNPKTGESEIVSFKLFPQWAKENGLKSNAFGELYK